MEFERKRHGDDGPIIAAVVRVGDSYDDDDGEVMPMADEHWDREFDSGFGCKEGYPVTAWTTERVYFPTEYDGAEGVASAPRNPCGEVTEHV
jgi:hypothetical protein